MSAFNHDFVSNALQRLYHYISMPNAVEVQVNRAGQVIVETPEEGFTYYEDPEMTLDYLWSLGRTLSAALDIVEFESKPSLATTLPGGHRLQLDLGGWLENGVNVSIRVWRPRVYTLKDYRLSQKKIKVLKAAILGKWNILVSGGMFSGKTTLTNALIELIPDGQRTLTVENARELDLSHLKNKNSYIVNRLATAEKITHLDAMKSVQRSRPDRTLIGELEDENAHLLARILNMGHGGTLATIHAESPDLAFTALHQLIEMAGMPAEASVGVFRRTIDIVIQVDRLPNYKRRVTEIWINPLRIAKEISAHVTESPLSTVPEIIDHFEDNGIHLTAQETQQHLSDLDLDSPEKRAHFLKKLFFDYPDEMNAEQRKACENAGLRVPDAAEVEYA
ncbi:ATPase, T2SS/T4P/T4SS family [Aestuariispira insulae]|uniref:Type IV secretory pathway ATPase VirB11/archaellum biosynthesis ATPase n=1 Tax=Aestuariispira insulae TaxID=1461337 RepID=A0A3D9H3N1_9PROT|nr:ATPase, T2SS/T4P/T4SS family [Aestuariispira insulae]RED44113.1 type IV secretory pathway ATPase VirB11/archaellum biosynthesis ATPase [Aestuariispira insulae]